MGKGNFKGWALPNHPIYANAIVQIGARMTQLSVPPVGKRKTNAVVADTKHRKSSD